MPLVLPNVIEVDTPADAAEVDQNYQVIQQYINTNTITRDGSVAMQQPLTLAGDPTSDRQAATKSYVDAVLPVGVMLPYVGAAAPAGRWALCNGAALATATYPDLFAVIGHRYGGSGGSFNVPNMAARVPVGLDSAQERFNATGKTGGSTAVPLKAHTHTINHDHAAVASGGQSDDHTHWMMNHTHTINHDHAAATTSTNGAHDHSASTPYIYQGGGGGLGLATSGASGAPMNVIFPQQHLLDDGSHNHTVNLASYGGSSGASSVVSTGGASATHTHTVDLPDYAGSSGSTGVDTEFIAPFVVVTYIIRLD